MRTFKTKVQKFSETKSTLGEVLEKMSRLNQDILKDAAEKGAVWLQKGNGKILKERSLDTKVLPQDTVSLFYEPKVLKIPAISSAECLDDNPRYGIWFKEAGVVAQGTQTGDHASLMRFIEKEKKKEVFLVHRLDRETAGLMVFAYTPEAAAKLGDLFQKNTIKKDYEAIVLGEMKKGEKGTINVSLDDKAAITHYEVLDSTLAHSLVRLRIDTGRLHQIRRHLDHVGHPVMGDPKYGKGNKNREGLKLLAKSLSFQDPWEKVSKSWTVAQSLTLM